VRRPTKTSLHRIREKASVFLAELHPAADAEAREQILATLRRRDHDATHHCSAWRAGVPAETWGCDDDGEPSGTAGKPMLRVLEGAELTDCLAVCIRWFGGTKLGTGGLVRAYTEAIKGAIAQAEQEGLLESIRVLRIGKLIVPPESAHLPFALLGAFPAAEILEQTFSAKGAVLRFACPPDLVPAVEIAWRDRSRGGAVDWE
jgi:putative IMPACT (imprinted ancient) family translation regulator